MLGVWVVIAALVPIAVSRYGVEGRSLWLSAALVALATWVTVGVAYWRSPDSREFTRAPSERIDRFFPVVGLPLHLVLAGSLVIIVLGVWRSADDALYVTALVAGLVFAGPPSSPT